VCLVARYLEAAGIPTVIVGSALDIVEHCGVPRFVFTDFPLGNPCGAPFEPEMQRTIVESALEVLETAIVPRTTFHPPFQWKEDAWRARYLEVRAEDAGRLAAKGEARRTMLSQTKADQHRNSPTRR